MKAGHGVVIETLLEAIWAPGWPTWMTQRSSLRHFKVSSKTIRMATMLYIRFLSFAVGEKRLGAYAQRALGWV
jgi:hypothetical protein